MELHSAARNVYLCCRSVCSGGVGYGTDVGYESCGQSAFATGSGERGAASSVVSLHRVCDKQYLIPYSPWRTPHSAPASRRPAFGVGAWAAPSSGIGGRPASANPAARQQLTFFLFERGHPRTQQEHSRNMCRIPTRCAQEVTSNCMN